MKQFKEIAKTLSVLFADDIRELRERIGGLLVTLFGDVKVAENGVEALEIYKAHGCDILVTDISMPEMDGLTLISEIRKLKEDQAIIILSAHSDTEFLPDAINYNVDGYVIKPFTTEHFVNTLKKVCSTIHTKMELKRHQEHLELLVEEKSRALIELNKEIEETLKYTLFTLTEIAEARSKETGNHVRRVAEYCAIFAKKLGFEPRDVELLRLGATMHDIGKIAISDSIIHKPGALTKEEFDIIKTHTTIGHDMLKSSKRDIFKTAAEVALCHHERWNGKGYPNGLKKKQIPINGRIAALADVYDALSAKRVYKEAWSDDRIYEFIKSEREESFDPQLVDIFFEALSSFEDVRSRYAD